MKSEKACGGDERPNHALQHKLESLEVWARDRHGHFVSPFFTNLLRVG